MRKFMLTSNSFEGDMIFEYDSSGTIIGFNRNCELSELQEAYLSGNFPFKLCQLQAMKVNSGKITEITDLSFTVFWNLYGYKVGGQTRSEKLWKGMSDEEKMKCIESIPKYKRFLRKKSIEQAYPSTYLNQKRYNDEFNV